MEFQLYIHKQTEKTLISRPDLGLLCLQVLKGVSMR